MQFLALESLEAVPKFIAQLARAHTGVTLLFMDIVNFTSMSKVGMAHWPRYAIQLFLHVTQFSNGMCLNHSSTSPCPTSACVLNIAAPCLLAELYQFLVTLSIDWFDIHLYLHNGHGHNTTIAPPGMSHVVHAGIGKWCAEAGNVFSPPPLSEHGMLSPLLPLFPLNAECRARKNNGVFEHPVFPIWPAHWHLRRAQGGLQSGKSQSGIFCKWCSVFHCKHACAKMPCNAYCKEVCFGMNCKETFKSVQRVASVSERSPGAAYVVSLQSSWLLLCPLHGELYGFHSPVATFPSMNKRK